jgi:hypothetical protein
VTAAGVDELYRRVFPTLATDAIEQLVTLTMALADGLFIAGETERLDLDDAFDLMATAILSTARAFEAQPEGTLRRTGSKPTHGPVVHQ